MIQLLLESGRWIDKKFDTHEIVPDEEDTKLKAGFYSQMLAFVEFVRNGTFQWPMMDLEGAYKTMLLAERICSHPVEKKITVEQVS